MKQTYQTPLFLDEIISLLKDYNAKKVIDATFGEGGHGLNLSKLGFSVLGIEWDAKMFAFATARIKEAGHAEKVILIKSNFAYLSDIVAKSKFGLADAIIFDLGLSMRQIAEGDRGFTYKGNEELDLRVGTRQKTTAKDVLNNLEKDMLFDLLSKTVEDKNIGPLIHKICAERLRHKFSTVGDLREIIATLKLPNKEANNLLRKLLQGLRMIVNSEMDNLEKALKSLTSVLAPKALVLVITFHSLEDRVVKLTMRDLEGSFRKVGKAHVNKQYPFARGAKLRVYERI